MREHLAESYRKATRSNRARNKYKEVLLACSLAASKTNNRFRITDVISGDALCRTTVTRLIAELCARKVLIEEKQRRPFRYRFADPALVHFVLSQGETAT